MDMKTADKILEEIKDFIEKSGMSEWQFGMSVCKNNKLINNLREGKPILSTTIDRIREFINDYGF